MPVPPALAARFRADLERLAPLSGAPFGVAVSGGPDSLALLLLCAAACPGIVHAATVDHQLRAESAHEAEAVARLCATRSVPHATLPVDVVPTGQGMQAAARKARYAALAAWAARERLRLVLTAHHADDQAETVLMRLARGAGSGGLAGIRARRDLGEGVLLVRPLLAWRKAELAEIVAAEGVAAIDDPANRDPRHDRTAARALLAATPFLDAERIARAAAHVAQAEEALAWTAAEAARSRLRQDDDAVLLDAQGLPAELVRRLVLIAVGRFGVAPDGPATDRLIAALEAGTPATIGHVAARPGPRWRFLQAPARR